MENSNHCPYNVPNNYCFTTAVASKLRITHPSSLSSPEHFTKRDTICSLPKIAYFMIAKSKTKTETFANARHLFVRKIQCHLQDNIIFLIPEGGDIRTLSSPCSTLMPPTPQTNQPTNQPTNHNQSSPGRQKFRNSSEQTKNTSFD